MEHVLSIINSVAILFIMMIPGVILKKCNMISDGFGKGLSNFVLYIAQPALIFVAYLKDFSMDILVNSLWVLLFSTFSNPRSGFYSTPSVSVSIELSSRTVARKVLSPLQSLTSVFGMGTGGPSAFVTLTILQFSKALTLDP